MPGLKPSRTRIPAAQLFASDLLYSEWANQRLLDSCANRTDDDLRRDLRMSHGSILATLQHICDGEKAWLDCLSTTAPGDRWVLPTGPAPRLTLVELRATWPELWLGYRNWLGVLAEPEIDLQADVFVQIPDGTVPQFTRWEILRHVLDHSQFHRGQVVGAIRSLGHTPPAINRGDYWLAGGSDGS